MTTIAARHIVVLVSLAIACALAASVQTFQVRISGTATFERSIFQRALSRYTFNAQAADDACPITSVMSSTSSGEVTATFKVASSSANFDHCQSAMNDIATQSSSLSTFKSQLRSLGGGTLVSAEVVQTPSPAAPRNDGDAGKDKTYIYIAAGVVGGLLILIAMAALLIQRRAKRQALEQDAQHGDHMAPLAADATGAPDAGSRAVPVDEPQKPGRAHAASTTAAPAEPAKEVAAHSPTEASEAPLAVASEEQPAKQEQPAAEVAQPEPTATEAAQPEPTAENGANDASPDAAATEAAAVAAESEAVSAEATASEAQPADAPADGQE